MTGAQLALFPFLILVLPLVAAAAWWLRRRYTAAIVRLQATPRAVRHTQGDDAEPVRLEAPSVRESAPRLHIRIEPARDVGPADPSSGVTGPPRLRRRVLLVHAAGELAYFSALTLFMIFAVLGQIQFGVIRMTAPVLLAFVGTPVAVAWILQAGLPRKLVTVASILLVIYAVSLVWSDAEGWESEAGFAFGYAAIGLMISAFMRPTIRGAGIPLVAASTAGWLVLSILFAGALALEGPDGGGSDLLGEVIIGVGELLIMLVAAAWCGWRTLTALSNRYAAKRFSDIQLALGTYWLLLTAFVMGSLVRDSSIFEPRPVALPWVAVGVLGLWLLWRRFQAAALGAIVGSAPPSLGALLLLRVFKPSGRSQAFTDRFFAYWRFAAPVWMIGGPDLAGAYLEPNEFFAYLRGRLREQFVATPEEIARALGALDGGRDPDGRFRVTEVYCTGDTWQPTVLEMMSRASVILLDLREYSSARRGTQYELTEVLRRAPLNKVVVLVDARNDVTMLRTEIERTWNDVSGSRAADRSPLELSVLQFRSGGAAEMHGLYRAAVRAARHQPSEANQTTAISPTSGTQWPAARLS